MSRIRIGEINLHVTDQGQGRPLVLVHGFPLDHSMWSEQIADLAGDYRVIAPDLRGFGESAGTEGPVSMAQFADDVAALTLAMGIDQPLVLCGLSMGGYVAWEFWRRYRTRLHALILCDTRAAADSPDVARARLDNADRVIAEGVGFLADSMLGKLFSPQSIQRQPELLERTRRVILGTSPHGVAAASRGMAARTDFTEVLPQIDVPTLLICGQQDVISPVAEMRGMAARIPDARFAEIPGAGHMSPLENPSAVNQAIRGFLQATQF
jgi:3-oxoadipate enol-lactonase